MTRAHSQVMPAIEGVKRDLDRVFDLLWNVLDDEQSGRTVPISESVRLWKAITEIQQIAVDWQLTYGLPRCAICDSPVGDDERATMYGDRIHDRPACRSKAQRRHARSQKAA